MPVMASRKLGSILNESYFLLPPSSLLPGHVFHLTVFIALLLYYCLSLASAIPFERRTTGVFTQCSTVPNTVALTFVRRSCLPPVYEADSFFRMTVHTYICTSYSSCRHNRCVLIPVFLREDVVTTLKNANAKGTFFFQFVKR